MILSLITASRTKCLWVINSNIKYIDNAKNHIKYYSALDSEWMPLFKAVYH